MINRAFVRLVLELSGVLSKKRHKGVQGFQPSLQRKLGQAHSDFSTWSETWPYIKAFLLEPPSLVSRNKMFAPSIKLRPYSIP